MVGSIAIVTTIVVGVIVSLWQQAERQRESSPRNGDTMLKASAPLRTSSANGPTSRV